MRSQEEINKKYVNPSIEGCVVGISRGLYKVSIRISYYEHGKKYMTTTCEYNSPLCTRAIGEFGEKHWIHDFYRRLSHIVSKNQAYLLGEEGVKEYLETQEDRKLARAIEHGAKIQKDGTIPSVDFPKEDKKEE